MYKKNIYGGTNNKKFFVKTFLDSKDVKVCKSSGNCPLGEFVKTLNDNVKNKCEVSA